tara:strand:- start:1801 stop:2601 length:801 start_codon:yes stop_codon:yes gene_type:complete
MKEIKKKFNNIKIIFMLFLIKCLVKKVKIKNIKYLGSKYGGWYFKPKNILKKSIIISAGLGEDASFDIELINNYDCKIIIIDPTPRAITHFKKILSKAGYTKIKKYSNHGYQNIRSYNLKKINKYNFKLIEKALFNTNNKKIKFFLPPNKNHVSHSINNWQNNYKTNSDFIVVKTINIKKIIKKFKISKIELIKLDIEGAEIQVIKNMLQNKIYPNQICVEFDELHKPSLNSFLKFFRTHKMLQANNYQAIRTNSKLQDMLYIRSN